MAVDQQEFERTLQVLRTWPRERRLELAHRLLAADEPRAAPNRPPTTLAELHRLLPADFYPPDDEETTRILEDERLKRSG